MQIITIIFYNYVYYSSESNVFKVTIPSCIHISTNVVIMLGANEV